MQVGTYRVVEPLEPGPLGNRCTVVRDDGTPAELRWLDRTRPDADGLRQRLRVLAKSRHPTLLAVRDVDFEHDPPYIVVVASEPVELPLPPSRVLPTAATLAGLLASVHAMGLGLGKPSLRRVGDRLVLDLADGGSADTTGDMALLADLLAGLGASPTGFPQWESLLRQMRSTDDPPTAQEAVEWFEPTDLNATSDSPAVDRTKVMNIAVRPPQVGDTVGRFRLLSLLGEGGMGVVYKAEDAADGGNVALKVLRLGPKPSDHPARRRFVREGKILARLQSPFITRLVDAGMDGARCFLAMEFVDGTNLGNRIRSDGTLDEPTALALIADAARGLAAAHSAGIVHRDVKPDNMLLTGGIDHSGPQLKMTDFGLAKSVLPTESMEVTKAGTAVGTPLYMAPEQFGSGPVDARADVYGLAATLFFVLAGRPPFQADGLAALAKLVAQEEPPKLERLVPKVSSATSSLVARCLSKDPSRRPVDAAALLRELERVRGGESMEAAAHPRVPAGSARVRTVVHQWDLKATPEQLWPYVSNTERLNRAAGLPSVDYTIVRDPVRGMRRLATARVAGMKMEWEEHPFEWVEGRRLGVLRVFAKGPFQWFLSVVELEPLPGGGTRLRQTLRADPRGLLGRIAARIELGKKAGKALGRVYQRIDQTLANTSTVEADPFEAPTQLTKTREDRVRAGVERLRSQKVAPEAAEMLGLYLSNAPEQEVARLRPLALAARFGIDPTAMTEACLRGVGAGLLQLQWDVICPLCRIPSARRDTLKELKEHEGCQACDKDFRTDFATSIELVFRVHPDIRPANAGTYCAGGPAHSPHVVAQAIVAAGEQLELDVALSPGVYQVRGPQLPWVMEVRIDPSASVRRCEVDLAAASPPRSVALAPGGQAFAFRNGRANEVIVRVERAASRDDALTAARAIALPAFRELFPGELLSPGQLAPASSVTLLWVRIWDGASLLDKLGEARAFQQVQAVFRAVDGVVRAEGGTTVKTVDDALLAAFSDVTAGVRAALRFAAAVDADPLAGGATLQAGVHRGLTLVAALNDRLDYFGQTVRWVTRLGDAAGRGELLLSTAVAGDAEVSALLHSRPIRLDELPGGDRLLAYRVPLTEETPTAV